MKTINTIITISAVIGIIIIIGAIGHCDYLFEMGKEVSLLEFAKTTLVGCIFALPAFIREVIHE